ncbi:hypothetical protein ACFE04_024910 [Oxalis oulophora]
MNNNNNNNNNKKKRKRATSIHPKNKYAENPPDFSLLASLYPSFKPFVSCFGSGRPIIDWTDFNATRELTRVLLLHDHALNWWIPDGQLCPTVPNRSNYIHWIEDLLSSDIIPNTNINEPHKVRGFDIGTGANCIYPLLGASLLGWSFVGSDVSDVALEWAEKNVKNNPHISQLVQIRNAQAYEQVLVNVVMDGEKFDFCMCNPPFFESMEEAGLNPKTACGGTPEEMVCPGGERAFITRIIEDSVILKQSFRWYTSMLGRKANLKFLTSKLWEVGATIVKTTEFVQGKTCRWGLAWSFLPPAIKRVPPPVNAKRNISFMLQGLDRQFSAIHVLQAVESFFSSSSAASCKLNASSFTVDITASMDKVDAILKSKVKCVDEEVTNYRHVQETPNNPSSDLCFCVTVFQQIPGTLLVKGSLQHKESLVPGVFSSMIQRLEEVLKHKFCR